MSQETVAAWAAAGLQLLPLLLLRPPACWRGWLLESRAVVSTQSSCSHPVRGGKRLLRIQAVQGLCPPATAVQPDEPSGHGRQAADTVCLVCASLPAMPPPDAPALAGPLRHAAPLPETAPQRRDVPARQAALPPARAPPNAA